MVIELYGEKKFINYDEFLYCEFICIVFKVGGLVV